jgi:hypothetical protein
VSKYQLVLRCRACQHKYKRIVTAENEEAVAAIPDPPCPKCAKKTRRTDVMETASAPLPFDGIDLTRQRAPGIVGANTMVKAVDKTAEIVMADHHLSDLKTNVRQGDTVAPPLPPHQQKMADNFFNSSKAATGPARTMRQKQMQAAIRRTLAGGNRAMSVDVKGILPDKRVALRKIGVEEINR